MTKTESTSTIGLSGTEILELELGIRAMITSRKESLATHSDTQESERLQRAERLLEKLLRVDLRSAAILEFIER